MIFISHSSADKGAAVAVRAHLLARGYGSDQIFVAGDPESGIPAGAVWEQVLYLRLKDCQALIVLCSESWRSSKWCFAELMYAKAAGKEIFPLLLEAIELEAIVGAHQAIAWYAEGDAAYERLWTALDTRHLGPHNDFAWPPPAGDGCPFPGLLSFDEHHAAVYFGRGPETLEILDELRRMRTNGEPRLLAVVGGSGSGKSSLLKAGILPRLKHKTAGTEWLVLPTLRHGKKASDQRTIFGQLALNLAEKSKGTIEWKLLQTAFEQEANVAAQAFVEATQTVAVACGSADATVLLPIDQFEELLAPEAGPAGDRFLAFLQSVFGCPNGRLLAIATMRSDFLDGYERHPSALTPPFLHAWRLGMLPRERIREVIVKPAARAHVELEPELVDCLQADTPTSEALPLLAFTLEKLYRQRADVRKMTLPDYDKLERMEGAIQKSAKAITDSLSPAELDQVRFVFVKHLAAVNEDGEVVRKRARWAEIPAAAQPIFARFVEERLLATQDDVVEVAHEALFRAWDDLREWLRDSTAILRWRRDVERSRDGNRVVLTRVQLAVARRWPETRSSELTEDELKGIRRAVLRERAQFALAAAIVTLIAGLAIAAYSQRRATERAAQSNLGRFLGSEAVELQRNRPSLMDLSFLLAIEAYRRDPSAITAAQLHSLLDATPLPVTRLAHEVQVTALRFSPDGEQIATGDTSGHVRVWDLQSQSLIASATAPGQGSIVKLFWRPDLGQIAIVRGTDDDQQLSLWTVKTGDLPVAVQQGKRLLAESTRSPDAWLVSAEDGHAVSRWSLSGSKTVVPVAGGGRVAVVSTDGKVAAAGSDRGIDIVDLRSGRVIGGPFDEELVTSAMFSESGNELVLEKLGGVQVWDWKKRQLLRTIGGLREIGAQAVSPGARFLGVIDQQSFRLFNVLQEREIYRLENRRTAELVTVRFSRNGRLVFAVLGDSAIRAFTKSEIGAVDPVLQFAPGEAEINTIDIDEAGTRVAAASRDGQVTVWSMDRGEPIPILDDASDAVAGPRGLVALFGSGVRIIDAGTGATVFGVDGQVNWAMATFSRDGKWFAGVRREETTAEGSAQIVLVDLSAKRMRNLARKGRVKAVGFSSDGQRLLIAEKVPSRPTAIVAVNVHDETETSVTSVDNDETILFSGDGRSAIVTDRLRTLWVHRFESDREPTEIRRSSSRTAVPSDARYVAVKEWDGIKVWRTDKAMSVLNHPVLTPNVELLFDPSGAWFALSEDSRVHVYNTNTWERLRTLTQIGGAITAMAFTPDATHLAAFCSDHSLRVWRMSDGELVTTIPLPRDITTIQFTSTGDRILIVRRDVRDPSAALVRLIAWRRDDVLREACRRAMRKHLTEAEWDQFLKGQPYRETCSEPAPPLL